MPRSRARRTQAPSIEEPYRGSFVGRARDLVVIQGLVDTGARLVTLLGPGGIGKTRLLYRVMSTARVGSRRSILCELAGARTSGDVLGAVASALGGAALGAATTTAEGTRRVGRALARMGDCLLALDNLEQLETTSLPLLSAWLAAAPRLVIVTTSRVRLGVAGETVHHVGPLSLATSEGPSEAMALFTERARAIGADLGPADLRVAERIVATLEGIPLAIEMAATRLAVLSPEELLARLARPLAALGGAGPGAPERHASLSRVLEGSWDLLEVGDREALAELGVFVGGFTLEAAEHVLSVSDVVERLQRLADSSLVRRAATRDGRSRFVPYEVVREFALERLAERAGDVRVRHAAYFAQWGLARSSRIDACDDAGVAFTELVADEANLAAAAAFALGSPGDDAWRTSIALLVALEPARMLRGQLERWLDDVEAALRRADEARPTALDDRRLVARARFGLARGAHELGRPTVARAAYAESAVAARASGDDALAALSLGSLGRLLANVGEWDRCFELFTEARAIAHASPSVRAFVEACHEFYGAETDVAHGFRATAAYVDVCRRGADPRELVFWLVQLGRAESENTLEEHGPAARLEEALSLARAIGDTRGEGYALFGLGSHQMIHERGEAVATLTEAVTVLREAGARRYAAWTLGFLAVTQALEGRASEAIGGLEDAASVLRAVGDVPREALLLSFRGAVLAMSDDEERARADLARASELVSPKSRYQQWTLDLCARQLDVLAGRRATARGAGDEARACFTRASRVLSEIGWPAPHDEPRAWPWGYEFYEPRLAARLLDKALTDARARGPLLVARDGSAFVLPTGRRVSIPGRGKLQGLLAALAAARADGGACVAATTLIEAGWPGERIERRAANNRLHVALDHLRRLGLRELLVRGEGGWRLEGEVPFGWLE